MIALPEFDNWPTEVDAKNPMSWSEGRLEAVQTALEAGRGGVTNALEEAILTHVRTLVRVVLLARQNGHMAPSESEISERFERFLRGEC